MSREIICQYGNCQETDTPFGASLSYRGEQRDRTRFCCHQHRALWLLSQAHIVLDYPELKQTIEWCRNHVALESERAKAEGKD